ncbi:MAG TPA: glycosyltransferase [Candidatus Acidoferrum sp.]
MRILNVTQSYAPFYEFGGPPVKVEALANGLARRGHEVTVLTADWGFKSRQTSKENAGAAKQSPFGWTRELDGVQSIYLPTWLRYRAATWNPAVSRYCRARLTGFQVAHIFGLYDLLGPAVARECRKQNIPYVIEPIGMFVPIVRNVFLKRVYHAHWGKEMLGGAAAVIATSRQEMEELAGGGILRTKLFLRRNGVVAPRELPVEGAFRAKHGIPADALLILFLGRLSKKKSPDLLLEAFAQLPENITNKQVWLAFAGPDESGMQARLEELARARGVRPRVVFSGAVFGERKWAAYRDANVFVLPSQNENFGNTAAEAAACGTPVVVTENCGVAPLLRGLAGIVVAHETPAVAQAVKQILSDAFLRTNLSEGGRKAVSRLGWDEPVERMEEIYAGLAAKPAVGGQSACPA